MADNAEYMILGYLVMAVLMSGLIVSLVWRFRALRRDDALIARYEEEMRAERAAAPAKDAMSGRAATAPVSEPSEAVRGT